MATGLIETLRVKARRDRSVPAMVRVRKGLRYLAELATARWHLRAADAVGPHARTLGKPRIENFGRLEIGAHVLVRSVNVPVELCTGHRGRLRIGDGVRINYGTSIAAESEVAIGNHCRIGPYVMIVDTDFHDPHDRSVRPPARAVTIEDDVWIGAKASVLKGVRIGRGAIIGVGAVVNRDVAAFDIVAGVPARTVGSIDPERFVSEGRT